MANAGHIPPYAGEAALVVECGLPFGIIAETEYTATTMNTGYQQLTFVSDGVVEAENNARELYGFERTRGISGQPTQTIAEAARAWGQNDDITVVTVRRTG